MYRVAICEDEPLTLENTRVLCEEILNELKIDHEISLFSSAEDVEYAHSQQKEPFHLLILDIQLGEKSGLTLAKEMYERNCDTGVIFMTNHREYAEEGYEAHPIHFLVKPVLRTRLTEAIKIDLKRKRRTKTVTINQSRKSVVLPVDEIYYIESRNHNLFICGEKECHELRMTLSEAETLLSEQFHRCHKSYLVNLNYVKEVGKSEVILTGDIRLPISRTYRDPFVTAYLRYFNTYLS